MIDEKTFRKLELINVKCDVLIDEEDYGEVFKIIKLSGKNSSTDLGRKLGDKPESKCYDYLLRISKPQNWPHLSTEDIDLTDNKLNLWLPLFLAKTVRAYLSRDGRDDAMACLDDVLMYLHHHLPAFPKNDQEVLLQHLYFQELAACGKPGLESLGYALRAADILKAIGNRSPRLYKKELYEFWSGLNQGIGFWHSQQRTKAAQEFNTIIKKFTEFDTNTMQDLSGDEKESWRKLLYYQALLFRAELQESLQFSYHTMQTLKRLNNAKREKRLIKEALAYRDMRRFDKALDKIKELLWNGEVPENPKTTLKAIFKKFDNWELGKKKAGIWSETAGLLFDFYLAKFEDPFEDQEDAQNCDRDVNILTIRLRNNDYTNKLMKSRPERTSYFQQVARYLRWLSDKQKKNPRNGFYVKQINKLYSYFRKRINLHDPKETHLSDFGHYEYDRFVVSMEKFYRNCNDSDIAWSCRMKDDERNFLNEIMLYEDDKFYLYDFKKLERTQRIRILDNGPTENCPKPSACFDGNDYQQFRGLLRCTGQDKKLKGKPAQTTAAVTDDVKELKDHDYESIMTQENDHFLEYLKYNSIHPIPKDLSSQKESKCSYHFMGLQRWNSQTPTLTLSKGGGYLLYKQDNEGIVKLGIAIDPGFDFVDNLFHMGFTLKDIHLILLTHAHLDHIRDFEPIVSALLDLEKRTKKEKQEKVKGRIHAIMTLGVYRKLENVITNTTLREFLADTYIVDIEREIVADRSEDDYLLPIRFKISDGGYLESIIDDKNDDFHVKITPTRAYHDDYSERSDSFGYKINVKDDGCEFLFGYTGDTRWPEDKEGRYSVDRQYSDCDVVCIHLGALIESEGRKRFDSYRGQDCEALIEKKWHPYLFGLLRWVKAIKTDANNKNRLILLSEFGEELKGGIRIDLVRRLNEMFPDKSRRVCIPVDIGLNVVLGKTPGDANPYEVWCFGCDSFVRATDIGYRHFGYGRGDEALFYFCETCLKSKPRNILQDKMQHVCESGIALSKARGG